MRVHVNSQPINTIRRSTYMPYGYVTRSRSVIVNLNVEDQVYVATRTAGRYGQLLSSFTEIRLC